MTIPIRRATAARVEVAVACACDRTEAARCVGTRGSLGACGAGPCGLSTTAGGRELVPITPSLRLDDGSTDRDALKRDALLPRSLRSGCSGADRELQHGISLAALGGPLWPPIFCRDHGRRAPARCDSRLRYVLALEALLIFHRLFCKGRCRLSLQLLERILISGLGGRVLGR